MRVTFGVAASPFAAIQTLQQTTLEFVHDYPMATSHVKTSFYVDDFLTEAATPQDALKLQQQLRDLFLKRVFDLQKWRSNSSAVTEEIPEELHDPSHVKSLTVDNSTQPQKALRVYWDSHKDFLSGNIAISLPPNAPSYQI